MNYYFIITFAKCGTILWKNALDIAMGHKIQTVRNTQRQRIGVQTTNEEITLHAENHVLMDGFHTIQDKGDMLRL